MAQLVNLPDGSQASFPDGTTPEVMKAAIQKKFPVQNAAIRNGAAAVGPAADPQNMYDTAVSRVQQHEGLSQEQVDRLKQQYDPSLFNLARAGTTFGLSDELSGLAGGLGNLTQPGGFGQGYSDMSQLQSATEQLAKQKNGMLGSAVELGTGLATIGPGRAALDAVVNGVKAAPSLVKTALASGGTGAALGGVGGFTSTDGDVGQRLQGAATGAELGGAVGTAAPVVARGLSALFTKGAEKVAAPAAKEIVADAGKIYDAARASGVEMPQSGTIALSDHMFQVAQDAGIVSPTGQIAKGYGKIGDVIDHLDQYSHGTMTVRQMQSTRELLKDAAGSSDKGERRVGTMMLKAFDNVVAEGVPQLAEAKPIYARAMRGQEVEKAIRKGGRTGNYATKMGQLSERIQDGKAFGYSPEEAAAIEAASHSGVAAQGLRGIANASFKTPLVNLAAWPVGLAAKAGATAMDKKAAQLAAALVKRGGEAPKLSSDQKRIAQALINSGLIGGPVSAQAGQQQ